MARLAAIVLALMASTALALPAVVIENREVTYTVGPVGDGTKVIEGTLSGSIPDKTVAGDVGGAITEAPSQTVLNGEAIGTALGFAEGALKGTIVLGPDGHVESIGGCIGGSLHGDGHEECQGLALPHHKAQRTAGPRA